MNLDAFLNSIYLYSENFQNTVAQCLGYRFGTGCYKRSRSTQMRDNWQNWQLCMKCARRLHPQYYKDKKNHGVNTFDDPDRITKPFMVPNVPLTSHELRIIQEEATIK